LSGWVALTGAVVTIATCSVFMAAAAVVAVVDVERDEIFCTCGASGTLGTFGSATDISGTFETSSRAVDGAAVLVTTSLSSFSDLNKSTTQTN
jgi:hypothetical protein